MTNVLGSFVPASLRRAWCRVRTVPDFWGSAQGCGRRRALGAAHGQDLNEALASLFGFVLAVCFRLSPSFLLRSFSGALTFQLFWGRVWAMQGSLLVSHRHGSPFGETTCGSATGASSSV